MTDATAIAPEDAPEATRDAAGSAERPFAVVAREAAGFARESRWRSWIAVLPTLALTLGCQVALLLDLPRWADPAVATLFGLLLVRVFIFYHDVLHRALFRDSRLGRALVLLFSVYFVYPPWVWRDRHLDHHRRNSQLDDRDIGGQVPLYSTPAWRSVGSTERAIYRGVRSWPGMLLGYIPFFLVPVWRDAVAEHGLKRSAILWPILQLAIVVGLVLGFGWWTALWAFVFPIWIATVLGALLFFVQHNAPGVRFRMPGDWNYGFAALESSTFLRLPRWQHWFTGNIGYHHVHHVNDRIPFYRLPEAMAAIPELQHPPTVGLGLRELSRCIALQLWDPERDRLVTLREAEAEAGAG